MKKSTKKTINYLKRFVGHELLRTRPTSGMVKDYSYTQSYALPILLVGFTSDGCIRYRHTGIEAERFDNQERVLPLYFTDRNWITKKAFKKRKVNLSVEEDIMGHGSQPMIMSSFTPPKTIYFTRPIIKSPFTLPKPELIPTAHSIIPSDL